MTKPTAIPGIEKAVHVAIGSTHACAVLADGTVKCWGRNNHGQLGPASALPAQAAAVPVPFPSGTKVTSISANGDTTCVVTEAGEVYCWGDNEDGQVGKTPSPSEPTPNEIISGGAISVSVTSNPGYDDIANGSACALIGLQVQCWGSNVEAQLGRGTQGGVDPTPAPVLSNVTDAGVALSRAKELGVGGGIACVRRETGEIYCWGDNRFGLFPPPADTRTTYASKVEGLPSDLVQLAVGGLSQLVVTKSGDVWGWGGANNGILATGSQDGGASFYGVPCASSVSKATVLPAVFRVTIGGGYALALTSDGRVLAWGANRFGTLGHLPGEQGDEPDEVGDSVAGLKPVVVDGFP